MLLSSKNTSNLLIASSEVISSANFAKAIRHSPPAIHFHDCLLAKYPTLNSSIGWDSARASSFRPPLICSKY